MAELEAVLLGDVRAVSVLVAVLAAAGEQSMASFDEEGDLRRHIAKVVSNDEAAEHGHGGQSPPQRRAQPTRAPSDER